MADVSDFTSVSGEDLTEAQLKGILRRIDLNIYNILDGKWSAVDYAEFGGTGHRKDPTKLLAQLRELRASYKAMLDEFPAEEWTQYDNPELDNA